ncbi:hypothetical protein [Ferrovibrio sp.]|uniref:hypothetical protein n=1 Tax=Ferrovibrio sp. TaxID=1917215 RepID=UPI002622D664|nr:hypothetical protein [Ferrovibrio sp.]
MTRKRRKQRTPPDSADAAENSIIDAEKPVRLRVAHPGKNPPAGKTDAKRQSDAFVTWLDRTLPLLQDQLGDIVTIDVTALPLKTKH